MVRSMRCAWQRNSSCSRRTDLAQITQSLIFVSVLGLCSSIPSLPLSIYQTFVLEERHGFNKTTPWLFFTDMLKGWLLAVVIGWPALSGFLWIFKWAGDRFIPWLMGFLYVNCSRVTHLATCLLRTRLTFQIVMILIYPTLIQPLFNKLSPLAEGELRTRIESLAHKLKFPLKHLYEIDGSKRSSHSNAYFFGLPWVRTAHTDLQHTH